MNLMRALGLTFLAAFALPAFGAETQKPDLVLFIVIDQFRSDYLSRFAKDLLPASHRGGLHSLIQQGTYFPNAEYEHLQCITAPDHATLVTGAVPALHGVVLNRWPDAARKEVVEFEMASLNGTTLADELRFASPESRTVGVALKNRSAQLLAGKRATLALAFDSKSWEWKSLSGSAPAWLEQLQRPLRAIQGQKVEWLTHSALQGSRESTAFPQALAWTTDAALRAARELKLGQRGVTDWLGVSFSSFDYAGHLYDTRSPEMKSQVIAVDRAIARLVSELSKNSRLWIVLTSDHGVAPRAEDAVADGLKAGRVNIEALRLKVNAKIEEEIGISNALSMVTNLHFYYSAQAQALSGEKRVRMEKLARETMEATTGIFRAFTATDIRERHLPGGLLEKQILNSYYPGRSGDIIALPEPYFINEREESVSHVTGYSYDRRVPLVIVAPGRVKAERNLGTIALTDLAPTLAALLDLTPPPLSQGRVLTQILLPNAPRSSAQ